jgi:regulatory protein
VHTITALKVQAKNERRVNVYLDGVFAFGLPDRVAASLRVGQLVSEEECAALRRRDTAERAYERALRFLSYRPRSTEEVARYLAGKQVSEDVAGEVIGRLQQADLLDDRAFARFWVENRESFRPRGSMALRYELRRKGVDDEAIEEAIRDVDEDEGAYRVAQAQARRLAGADRESFRRRLGGYLSRRGYAYATARETVERLWREVSAHDGTS